MAFKWIGGGLLLLSAFVYCYRFERGTAQTKRVLSAWIALLTDIKRQISCCGTPLSDILQHADPDVVAVLEMQAGPLTATGLGECCRAHAARLPAPCGELLARLSQEWGRSWRQEEIERLNYYITELTQQKEAYCVSAGGAARLRRTLIFCGALGIILLFW
jgi:hypothetical protein